MPIQSGSTARRILIADGDPLIRNMLSALIKKEGHSVVVTADGRAAYRELLADSDFAAVILNQQMAHLQGLDIVRYMRSEKRLMKIPLVIMSGGTELGLMIESFAAGANAFLRKPFTRDQLEMTLHLALSQSQHVERI